MQNSKDLEKLEEKQRKNKDQRRAFVKRWAKYVRDNPDKDWSKQQKVVLEK